MNEVLNNGWQPNPKWHAYLSFLKSCVRIIGLGYCLFNPTTGIIILASAELIGILEEMV